MDEKKYEGSAEDYSKDYAAARRKGITVEQYENSAADRIADAAGERRMRAAEEKSESPRHTPGQGAFKNAPKTSHGFGRSVKVGHLRCSGHPGAHRIGAKRK